MFTGLLTALITPFTPSASSIDWDALLHLIDIQLDAQVDGIVLLGTTGEAPTISYQEKEKMLEMLIHYVKGRGKVIIGTGTNCTKTTIKYSQMAETFGADALLVVNPYYNKPTQKGLYEHFLAIADAVRIPVILYNIPGRTAINLSLDTIEALSQHPNISGIKEASGDIGQITRICETFKQRTDFTVLSGDDAITDRLIRLGGDGVVSVVSNILPHDMKQWVQALLDGEDHLANTLRSSKLERFFEACCIETNPIPIKTLMAAQGLCNESFRLPMTTMHPENKHRLFESVSLNF